MEFKELTHTYTSVTAECVKEILSPLEFYSKYAREQEINKYSSDNLWQFVGDRNRHNLIAVDRGEVVGFAFGVVDAHVMFMVWIGMKEKYRRSNHMKTMWEMMEDWCRTNGIHKIWCDTNQLNIPSIRFVEKLGYSKVADLKNFWYGHDYFLWEKQLNG